MMFPGISSLAWVSEPTALGVDERELNEPYQADLLRAVKTMC
jgi:hypothetical protein